MIETLNEDQVKQLKGAVQEAVDSMYRSDAEKQLRADISDRMKEDLEMPKKTFNALAKIAYKQEAEKYERETTEVLDLAEQTGFYKRSE